jgi:bacillithiol biosynthesis cysteine-adding enzyme BshC
MYIYFVCKIKDFERILFLPKASLNLYMQKLTLHRTQTHSFSKISEDLVYNQSVFKQLINREFSIKNIETQIEEKKNNYSISVRKILVDSLKKQYEGETSIEVLKNIELLNEENTFTITTGHQLNLFGGPLYVVYKILHIITLSERLKLEYPKYNFVPLFWLASEDHDFEEVNHVQLFNQKITWDEFQGGPVGLYETKHWTALQEQLSSFFLRSESNEIKELIATYSGETVADATKNLIHFLFHSYGLVVLDPNRKELKEQFKSVFLKEIEHQFVESAVELSNEQIQDLGYKPQAFVRPINIFYIEKGIRERIVKNNSSYTIPSKGEFTKEELIHLLEKHPERFSPNVMLRPLYQETLLPNLVYVGGGGEISYWIQQKGIFDSVNIPYPLIQVRASIQLIESKTLQKWETLGFSVPSFFKSLQELQNEFLEKQNTVEIDYSELDNQVSTLQNTILEFTVKKDKQLGKFAEAEITKLMKQIEGIKAKVSKLQKQQFEIQLKQIEDIRTKALPLNGLQERYYSFFHFCAIGKVHERLAQIKSALDPLEKDLIILTDF